LSDWRPTGTAWFGYFVKAKAAVMKYVAEDDDVDTVEDVVIEPSTTPVRKMVPQERRNEDNRAEATDRGERSHRRPRPEPVRGDNRRRGRDDDSEAQFGGRRYHDNEVGDRSLYDTTTRISM